MVVVDVHVIVDVVGFWRMWLQSGPFEGPTTVKPSALLEDTYYFGVAFERWRYSEATPRLKDSIAIAEAL